MALRMSCLWWEKLENSEGVTGTEWRVPVWLREEARQSSEM